MAGVYGEGLHQAIEAKEEVQIQSETRTLATVTYQNFFRIYEKLAGMTGTAKTEEEELRKIYGLDVDLVPTHKDMIREDRPDFIYKNEAAKYRPWSPKSATPTNSVVPFWLEPRQSKAPSTSAASCAAPASTTRS